MHSQDFEGNLARIRRSIAQAKTAGSRYRLGPELEVTGYLCEDHFLEQDTFNHAWECLAELIKDGSTNDILCDIGMPVMYKSARYNCRVFVLDGRILLIRPKILMADDGNYREGRYFTAWTAQNAADAGVSGFDADGFVLPPLIAKATGQSTAPFGVAILDCADASIGSETCEEMFSPCSPHIQVRTISAFSLSLFALN